MNRVTVSLPDRAYEIYIGSNLLSQLAELIENVGCGSKSFVVVDRNVESTHAKTAMDSFDGEIQTHSIDAIESSKTMPTVEHIWESMLSFGCDRQMPLIAIGGGLTGDVAGFAAATFMRGVPLIQVPTTLLAMVDASIGGKTGINLPIHTTDGDTVLGKNLAGAFWQPKAVFADVATLETLDDRQFRCGLAECVKHGLLGHQHVLTFITENVTNLFARDTETLIELVTTSAAIKADVVARDEREHGLRALLNLGHTFAHAIEPLKELGLFHGEAVSIGLVAAVSCAEASGRIDGTRADQLRSLLTELGLPIRLPMPVDISRLLGLMRVDKKSLDAKIRLVLPTNEGAEIVEDIDDSVIALAWTSVGASL
jgi:3-dehydroquinate synthase